MWICNSWLIHEKDKNLKHNKICTIDLYIHFHGFWTIYNLVLTNLKENSVFKKHQFFILNQNNKQLMEIKITSLMMIGSWLGYKQFPNLIFCFSLNFKRIMRISFSCSYSLLGLFVNVRIGKISGSLSC